MTEDVKLKKYLLAFSIVLFLLSLTQKCYCTTSNCGDSIMVFLLGWAAIVSGGAGIAWIANPLLIASWLTLKKHLRTSMFLSVFATLLALSFLLFDNIIDSESGHRHEIISYKAGYWFWTGSSICMLFGTYFLTFRYNRRKVGL